MCDKNSNLNKAILKQVGEFATNQSVWSIHDITVELRKKANAGTLNIPEFEVQNQPFKYNIPHVSVKNGFTELLNDGIFTEINLNVNIQPQNNPWREYTATVVTSTVNQPQVVNAPPANTIPQQVSTTVAAPPKISKQMVEAKISNYLDHHIQQTISIEQIRAAIKSNGWTCAEIQDIVASLVDYNDLTRDPQYPSKSMVVV